MRVGYERCGLNFNLPVGFGGLDLSLGKADLTIGSVGLLATLGDRIGVFANLEGSLQRSVSVIAQYDQPLSTQYSALDWSGSKLRKGSIEAGFVYQLYARSVRSSRAMWRSPDRVFLIGGVRWNKISTKLTGPKQAFGFSGSFDFQPFGAITYNASGMAGLSGDVNVPMFIPYLGLQFTGRNYRATIIGSPFASVRLRIPLRLPQDAHGGG